MGYLKELYGALDANFLVFQECGRLLNISTHLHLNGVFFKKSVTLKSAEKLEQWKKNEPRIYNIPLPAHLPGWILQEALKY